ncbi:hypothetical protein HNR46_002893 [Haloferula luteola]|uniref:Uncharacterized protein n=1 Tax=Haloferula luteola TaxID=595692 RepID=A0A840V3R5_9BACT|nr:hypothetical protein [Haloferula luteola]
MHGMKDDGKESKFGAVTLESQRAKLGARLRGMAAPGLPAVDAPVFSVEPTDGVRVFLTVSTF